MFPDPSGNLRGDIRRGRLMLIMHLVIHAIKDMQVHIVPFPLDALCKRLAPLHMTDIIVAPVIQHQRQSPGPPVPCLRGFEGHTPVDHVGQTAGTAYLFAEGIGLCALVRIGIMGKVLRRQRQNVATGAMNPPRASTVRA